MKYRHILITGASGFIGRHLHQLVIKEFDSKVTVVSRRQSNCFGDSKVISKDLCELSLDDFKDGLPDLVFHVAANASVDGQDESCSENIYMTERLLTLCHRADDFKRFVFVSSVGAVDRSGKDIELAPLTESDQPNPLTDYGKSKLECEYLVRKSGLLWSIVRPPWVVGPGMRSNSHLSTLERYSRDSHWSSFIHFPGRVSLLHVEDFVRSLCVIAKSAEGENQTFFAGANVNVSLGDIVQRFNYLNAKPRKMFMIPNSLVSKLKPLRRFFPFKLQCAFFDLLTVCPNKLQNIGFEPVHGFDSILSSVREKKEKNIDKTFTVITGAASGIGSSLAMILDFSGKQVLLIDRDEEALNKLNCHSSATYFPIDLTEPFFLKSFEKFVSEKEIEIEALINCAGVGVRGLAGEVNSEQTRNLLSVNIQTLVDLSEYCIKKIASFKTLVNFSSSAAFQPLPFMASYAASKAFVLSYSESISAEYPNLNVITVCPSGTRTNFQSSANVKKNPNEKLLDPFFVGAKVAAEMERGESATVFVGCRTYLMSYIARLLPRNVCLKVWKKMMTELR